MLIKPFHKIIDDDNDIGTSEVLNSSEGILKQMKNTIYLIRSDNADNSIFPGKEVYDVILVSEMIKKLNNIYDFADFNELYNYMTTGVKNDGPANYFCKVVHIFNGVCNGISPRDNPADKLKDLILYPNISFSIGERENKVIPQSKVMFVKHGSKILSSVYYTHRSMNKLADLNIMGREEVLNRKELLTHILSRAGLVGPYFDITDPMFPNAIPYKQGSYSKASDIKRLYRGRDLLSSLINLQIKSIDTSKIQAYEREKEIRNINLRKELMSLDSDNENSIFLDTLQMRLTARNIAIDFVKISICSMMESIEIIYDTGRLDDEIVSEKPNGSGIKNIGFPFNKVSKVFLVSKMSLIVEDFNEICEKHLLTRTFMCSGYTHFRITLSDNAYETVVKITAFFDKSDVSKIMKSNQFNTLNLTKSETFRLNKSEAIHDYLIEGIHNSNENMMTKNSNMLLLTTNK